MKKYVKNSVWILAEKVIRLSVVFLFFSFVSKKLSLYEFGIFTLAQTFATLLTGIVAFGFDNVLIKEFSTTKASNSIFSSAMIFRGAGAFLCVLIFALVILNLDYPYKYKYVFILASFSAFFQLQTIYYSYFQAVSKSFIITKTSIYALMVSSVFKIAFLYYDLGLVYYTISFLLDYVFSFLFIYIVSRREALILRFKFFDKKELRTLLAQAVPIFISTLIVMIYTRIDQFMVVKFLGVEQVALFNVAIRISDAYMFIPIAIAASFFPMVSKDATNKSIKQYFYITHLFTVLSAMFILVLTPIVISVFFGERYSGSIQVVYIIVIANVISALGMVSSNILIIRKVSYLRVYRAMYGLVINIGLNYIFIPKFGILGAAYSSLFSQIIAAWVSNYFSAKTRDCFYLQTMAIFTFGIPCIKDIILAFKKRTNEG